MPPSISHFIPAHIGSVLNYSVALVPTSESTHLEIIQFQVFLNPEREESRVFIQPYGTNRHQGAVDPPQSPIVVHKLQK